MCTFLCTFLVSESDVYRAQPTRTTTFYLLKSDQSHFFEERSSGRNQDWLCWRRTRLKHNWSSQKYNALIVLNQTNLWCSHKFILRSLWTREPASLAFDDEQYDRSHTWSPVTQCYPHLRHVKRCWCGLLKKMKMDKVGTSTVKFLAADNLCKNLLTCSGI